MPVPSAIRWAASTFMRARDSGSISGWAGLLGQTCCGGSSAAAPRPAARLVATATAASAVPPLCGERCQRLTASGTTATGFALSRWISAGEIVAAIALMMWKLCTCVACNWASSESTGAWAALAAPIRSRVVAPRAGKLDSWFLKMMIERSVA